MNILIVGIKNQTNEGVTLLFNEAVALNNRLKSKEWFVSWDRIGAALFGDKYCQEIDVSKLNKLRITPSA